MLSPIYQPLRTEKREIRLISINPELGPGELLQCSLSVVSLDSCPVYTALSYVWGDGNDTTSILLNGRKTLVPSSANVSLRFLRKNWNSPPTGFWIDAISINQENVPERNDQVQLMGTIYASATVVVACLMPGSLDVLDSAISSIEKISKIWDTARSNLTDTIGENEEANLQLLQVLSRIEEGISNHDLTNIAVLNVVPYWSRIWIVQEMLLAKDLKFFCGDTVLMRHDYECLTSLSVALSRLDGHDNHLFRMRADWFALPITQSMIFWNSHKNKMISDRGRPFMHMLRLTWTQNATDERDKAYGLLGLLAMSDPDISIKPDYSLSVADVYSNLIRSLAARYGKLFLNGCHGLSPQREALPGLPSWSLDLRSPPQMTQPTRAALARYSYCASGDSSCAIMKSLDPRVLEAKGIIISTVTTVAPQTTPFQSRSSTSESQRTTQQPSTQTLTEQESVSPKNNQKDIDYDSICDSWISLVESLKTTVHPRGFSNWAAFFRIMFRDYYDDQHEQDVRTPGLIARLVLGFWFDKQPYLRSADAAAEQFSQNLMIPLRPMQSILLRTIYKQLLNERPGLLATLLTLGGELRLAELILEQPEPWPADPLTDFNEEIVSLLCGLEVSQGDIDFGDGGDLRQSICGHTAFKIYKKCLYHLFGGGQLFATENGYMGVTHATIQTGDQICIVLGSDLPLLVRAREDHYVVLGSCYVPGLMYGEVVQDIEQGRYEPQYLRFL